MIPLRTMLAGATLVVAAMACDRTPDSATAPAEPSATRGRTISNITKAPRMAGSLALAAAGDLETTDLTSLTATQVAQTIVGSGVAISNVQYAGATTAAGTFTGDAAIVGFESGIVLSSGNVADVTGPNESDDITGIQGTPGDPDLTALAGFQTYDAAVLSFDFVPAGQTITFQYVFASDEYNEYVNTEFNDVFAFYVNGTNCAVVGSPARPVSINTINNGNPELPDDPVENPATNPDLYRDNDLRTGSEDDAPGPINTEMDGLTTVLTCTASVTPGVTNTMKLAIADASDPLLDAAVFIKAGSFVAPNLAPTATITAPATGASFAQGATVSFSGSAADPEEGALTGASLVWTSSLDGALGTGTSVSTTALSVGTHTITLRATDAGGASGTATIQITIGGANAAPVPTLALSPQTIPVDGSTAATTGASDPDDAAATLVCSINWGDGAVSPFGSCTAPRTHTYTAAGLFTVTFTARDPGGALGSVSDTVRVVAPETNTPPEIVNLRTFPEGLAGYPLGGASCYAREQVCIKYTITDVDAGDEPFQTTVTWGDDTPTYMPNAVPAEGIPLLAYHRYAAAGTYTVTVTATDRRGASSTQTIAVRIDP